MVLYRCTIGGALFASCFSEFFEFSHKANSAANRNSSKSEIFSIEYFHIFLEQLLLGPHFRLPLKRPVQN
ncbi:hypothetical protein Y032_0031g2429 [Ancylostoma ceylanicum]|uniref:Uncharacterized protein n=1 Tax=Ancylostoma ceylanicum TaxID=53326 RepID=A0A016URA5_9BILA|nr:hypothetical protein Y032_0031g2429 [Ancylostoma ceylanicum]